MAATLAPAPQLTQAHGMCLKHGDYHSMAGSCWSATADFFFARQDLPERTVRELYALAVERAMLDNLLPLILPATGRH